MLFFFGTQKKTEHTKQLHINQQRQYTVFVFVFVGRHFSVPPADKSVRRLTYRKRRGNVLGSAPVRFVNFCVNLDPLSSINHQRQAMAGMVHRPPAAGEPTGFVFEEENFSKESVKSLPGVALFAAAGMPVVVIDAATTDDLKVGGLRDKQKRRFCLVLVCILSECSSEYTALRFVARARRKKGGNGEERPRQSQGRTM